MTSFSLRTVFGFLYAGLWLGTLWLNSNFYSIFLIGVSLVVTREFLNLQGTSSLWKVVLVCGLTYGLFQTQVPLIIWAFGAVLIQLWLAYHMVALKKLQAKSLSTMAIACFHICAPIFLLLYDGTEDNVFNQELITGFLLLVWTTDSVAFGFGSWLGKRPLYAAVSPNKTMEGAIAAICITPIVGYGMGQYSNIIPSNLWLLLGLLVAVLSIIGDLAQSHIKRLANVKDSGKLMPGHGGLYDRIDSLIFVVPFSYIILYYIT
ncbi:MAG: phosphatidate cytidylyltransferase [Flavobacteriaceae bacterium]